MKCCFSASPSISAPERRSAINTSPAFSFQRLRMRALSSYSTPASEDRISRPSSVSAQRSGRRPLRSSEAHTLSPSEYSMAAGPSQGSIIVE